MWRIQMLRIRCHSAHQEVVFLAINLVVARFVNFTTCCRLQDRHFHWGSSGFVSQQLAEAWLSALRPACPTHSAATPGGRPPQKTMNLYHRNVPWLFGGRGQNLGRIHASPAVPIRRSRSLTRKWTINRTPRWVSRAHFASHTPLFALKSGRKSQGRKSSGMVGAADELLIGGRRWKCDWWVSLLERYLQLSLFGSKGRVFAAFRENFALRLSSC